MKRHQLLITSSVHCGAYCYQVTPISDQYLSRFCAADAQTHRRRQKQYLLARMKTVLFGELLIYKA